MRGYTRMKRIFLEGLLWLYLFEFGLMALSLEPGYLDFDNLPDTNFTCIGKVIGGYYADLEANCQMFHVCTIGQADEPMDIRFLCLNGTVFDQETRVCERIDEVDCSKSEQFYSLNLELYGNSGPILEESPEIAQETEPPSLIIKSTTSTTTTTTTTTKRPSNRPTSPPFYTTVRPPAVTTAANKPKVVSTHHFPVNAPDIRFNPEEINISLNPGAPPDIRTKHFLQQSFSDSSQDLENENSGEEQSVIVHKPERLHVSSSTSPKSIYAPEHKLPQNSASNFAFSDVDFQTEIPQRQQQFLIQTNSFRHSQSFPPNVNHHANQYHHQRYHSTTAKHDNIFHLDPAHTTLQTIYLRSFKPPEIHQHHHYTHHHRTEKPPQRVQIPIPLLPTLPPLTFSSPAPFTLQRHIETKRYTKDHPAPPRIIISASASVSDASGRRLNYSLGTIGAAQILKAPPSSYDDYKDSDVVLDPFFHDVPKLNQKRRKRRSAAENEEKINPFEIIKNEKEAVEVLKFLFTWYQSHQATATVPPVTSPVTPNLIHKINFELAAKDSDELVLTDSSEFHFTNSKEATSTESLNPMYDSSELLGKSGRYSIIGGYKNLDSKSNHKTPTNSLDKHNERFRYGKNLELDDLGSEGVSDTELKEKMDDSEVTLVKDLKEAYFNPYDYVDDNYEGVVYKENGDNITKDTNSTFAEKEPDIKNITDYEENKNASVNPVVVAELYKYFNVNRNPTTENSKINSFADSNTKSNIEDAEHYTHAAINNKNEEIIEVKKSLVQTTPSILNNTEIPNVSNKFTEINVLSEGQEEDDTLKNSLTSSSSSTTTSERPYPKKSAARRGRGRQRQYTNNYAGQKILSSTESFNTEHEPERKKINTHNLKEQNSVTQRQSRKRGRSRFVDYYSSTSTTTVSPTSKNIYENESDKENLTTVLSFSTLPTLIESTKNLETTLEISGPSTLPILLDNDVNLSNKEEASTNNVIEQHQSFDTNVSEQNIDSSIKETTSETNKLDQISSTSKNKNFGDIPSYNEIKDKKISNIPEELGNKDNVETQEQHDLVTENYSPIQDTHYNEKDMPTTKLKPIYETTELTNSETLQVETTSLTSKDEEASKLNETTVIANIEHLQVDTSNETIMDIGEEVDHSNKHENLPELLPELPPIVNTTDDPTYFIKLLRYFAETALSEEQLTTEISEESYAPLTEGQVFTTEKTLVPLRSHQDRTGNKSTEHKRGRIRGGHRHTSKVSTTELPTLRGISNKSNESEIKHGEFHVEITGDQLLGSKRLENNINAGKPLNHIIQTTELPLNVPHPDLEENIRLQTKSNLLERLTLIEQNLGTSVTNAPIIDTTITTPYVSFENAQSFGTTIPSITDPTLSFDTNTEVTKDLTQMFEISTTESKHLITSSEAPETNKHYYGFYEDDFVVPELTENDSYKAYTEANKYLDEKTITAATVESTSSVSNGRLNNKIIAKEFDVLPATTDTHKLDSRNPYKLSDDVARASLTTNLENDLLKPNTDKDVLQILESSTLQPDVEIQKSISLPVSVLQGAFDVSHDINNAQDINNLVPTSEVTSTLRTTDMLQEYIQDIETNTKSVVAKDYQVKLGFTEGYDFTATETVPTTLVTTEITQLVSEATTIPSIEEHINLSVVSEVQHNATEILFVKNIESSSENYSITSIPTSISVESASMVNSSHLLEVVVDSTTTEPVTTRFSTTRIPYHTRRTRPPKRRPYNNQKGQNGRHRFSTELFTNKPPMLDEARYKQNLFTSKINQENVTEAPLHRSATPTRSELKKVSLHTTPLSSKNSRFPSQISKNYVFNCFGKDKNKFYADPRDCRLFHYCTQGYSKNQLLDLKFVCDQKTFFDDNKLTCTRVKPTRCL